jgi:hypothetical protein
MKNKIKNNIYKTIVWIMLLSIAMAFMEASVVIYLRALYYPNGFIFPLKLIDPTIALTEYIREIATIIILVSAGVLAGKKNIERFAFFILAFAIWDIFYYIFLKIILGWPDSIFTWDILFMVPVTWVSPVIAPIINSLTMILLAISIIFFIKKNGVIKIGMLEWLLLILGSFVIVFTYTQEYTTFMLKRFSLSELLGTTENIYVLKYACSFIPKYFNWYIFGIGCLLHSIAIVLLILKNKKTCKY